MITLLLFLLYEISSSSLKVVFSEMSSSYNFVVNLGKPSTSKYFEIDLKTPFNWATKNYYHRANSKVVKSLGFDVLSFETNVNLTMELLSDYLSYGPIDMPEFTFYFSSVFLTTFDSISFARTFKDNKNAVIYHLYNSHLITKLGFGLFPNQKGDKGVMYLGEINSSISPFNYMSVCKAVDLDSKWWCNLEQVIIGNNKIIYNNTFTGYFQTKDRRIVVPKNFMSILDDTYFNNKTDNKVCVLASNYGLMFYDCNCREINDFPDITFKIDNNYMTFTVKDLTFFRSYDHCSFLIEENLADPESWLFGLPFYRKYPTYFDYEQSTITFYSKDQVIGSHLIYSSSITNILRGMILILVITILINILQIIYIK